MKKLIGELLAPSVLKTKIPLSEKAKAFTENSRQELKDIISGKSNKKILIIGPCSADFEESLYEYADFLSKLQEKVEDKIKIVLRFYTGKPRTIGGWKGLQNSAPGETPDLISGIENSRKIAVNIIEKYNLPLADELLHPQLVEHIGDLYSYFAIGARSSENQFHREVSSGLDFPVGMKNPTSGNISIMLNSVQAGTTPSVYVIGNDVYETSGNSYCHSILRGGITGPNYDLESIKKAYEENKKRNIINKGLIIDTNHDNSQKKYEKQIDIMQEVMNSISENKELKNFVKGFMVESYLFDGRQDYSENIQKGLSLTDLCIGKERTEELIMKMYNLI
ncbi:MAG: 3-deoxy-7-phosphoheptulonate synthase [Candidatus Gracilibacteria bacterium]